MVVVSAVADDVILLTLDDGKVNVLDFGAVERLTAAFRDHADRAVVITGAGRAFCAGVDLRPVVELGRPYVEEFLPALDALVLAVLDHPRPVVAAVNGHALAGGAILAMAADRTLMSAGTIGLTELAVGVPFSPAALETVRMAAGHRAAELVLGARRLDPEQALAAGIVDELVAPVELDERASAVARQLAAVPVETYAATKRALRADVRARIDRDTAALLPGVIEAWSGEPVRGAIRRYLSELAGKAR